MEKDRVTLTADERNALEKGAMPCLTHVGPHACSQWSSA